MTYVRELRDQSGGRLGVIEVSMRMADIFPESIDPVTAAGPVLLMKIGIYMTAGRQRQPANGSPIGG